MSHRLFNFHEGHTVVPEVTELIGCNVIHRFGHSDVQFTKARDFNNYDRTQVKLMNLIYDKETYYLTMPGNPDSKRQANIIENYPWLVAKFYQGETEKNMGKQKKTFVEGCLADQPGYIRMKVNDTIRFGRIPFRVTRMKVPGMRRSVRSKGKDHTLMDISDEESDDGPGTVPTSLEE